MPTIGMMDLPRPKSWEEFQNITTDALKSRWQSYDLQQYGRGGQAQQGVDIYGSDNLGERTGVQCKLTSEELSLETVKNEMKKAELFTPALSRYFIATSGRRDTKIQAIVRVISEARVAEGKFGVGIIFWDDIVQDLLRDKASFEKHYPQLTAASFSRVGESTQPLLAALDLAYDGLSLKQHLTLIFGEVGQMAQEDPGQFDALLFSVVEASRPFCSDADHAELCADIRACLRACGTGSWEQAESLATRIEGRVGALEHACRGPASKAYSLGRLLRQWDFAELDEKKLGKRIQNDLELFATAASDSTTGIEVREIANEYDLRLGCMTNPNRAHKAYNLVRRAILRK